MCSIRRRIQTSLSLLTILSLFLNVLLPVWTIAAVPAARAASSEISTPGQVSSPGAPASSPTPAPKVKSTATRVPPKSSAPKATPTPVAPKPSAPKGSPCTPSARQPVHAPSGGAVASAKQPTFSEQMTMLDCSSSSATLAPQASSSVTKWWVRKTGPYNGPGYDTPCPDGGYDVNRAYPTDTCIGLLIQTGANDNDKFTWNFYQPDGIVHSSYWIFYDKYNPNNWCAANYPSYPYEWRFSGGDIYCNYFQGGDIGVDLVIQCVPGYYCDPTTRPGQFPGQWPTEIVYTAGSGGSTTIVSDYFTMFDGLSPEQTFATEQGCLAADPTIYQGAEGDPVNPFTGNYTEQFVDLSIPARGFPLTFERSYNSLDAANATTLGYGWTHNYNMHLTFSTQYSVTIASSTGTHGSMLSFTANPDSTFSATPGVRGQLTQNPDGSYTLSDNHGNLYFYDTSGRLTQMTDANGNSQTLNYNGSQLASVSDPSGRLLQFGYDGSGRINLITDPLNRTVGFGYDGSGNLTTVTDTRGFVTTMTYDANHHLQTIVDANQHTQVTNHYDAQNRVDYQLDALNQQTTFTYSPGMTQTIVTDRRGNPTTYNYSPARLLASAADALGHRESYIYDGDLNRTSVTDRNGHQTQFTWAANGCGVSSVKDAQGNQARFTYDSNNNLKYIYDPLNRQTVYNFDTHNNLLSIAKPISGTIGFGYDGLGQLISRTDENSHTTRYSYDAYGNRTVITDTLTHVTNMAFDLGGRMTDLTDALGHRTHYEYDAANRVTKVVLNYDSTRGQNEDNQYNLTTQYGYDPAGNLTFITNTLGLVTKTDYDAANRPQTVTVNYVPGGPSDFQTNLTTGFTYDPNGNRQTATDAKNQTTRFDYDLVNRLSSTTDALNHTTHYSYDAAGNQTQVLDANNNSTWFGYDSVNRLNSLTDGLGNKTQYGYDVIGNRTSITDALGIVTAFGYDGLNRLTRVTENYIPGQGSTVSQNVATSYGYDNVGNLAQVVDAKAHPTIYTYDELNRLKTTRDALGHTTTNSYDAVGNLESRLDANNATTGYVYDRVDRLVQINYPTSSVTFAYDPLGHRTTMLDSAGVSQYGYDAVYRLNTVTDPFSQTVGYSYDRAGNRVSLSYPDGKSVSYGYDDANLLRSVTDWSTQSTQYTYDNANRLTNTTMPNGVSVGYAYDKANRLTMVEYGRGTTLLGRIGYTLDAAGNRKQQSESFVDVESGILGPNVAPTLPNRFYLPLIGAGSGSSAVQAAGTPIMTSGPMPAATQTAALVPSRTSAGTPTQNLAKTATPPAIGPVLRTPRVEPSPKPRNGPSQPISPTAAQATRTPTPTLTRSATPLALDLNLSFASYPLPAVGGEAASLNLARATDTPTPTVTRTPTSTNTPTPTPTALPTGTNNTVIDYIYDPLYRLTQAKYSTYNGGPLSPMLLRSLGPLGKATDTPTATNTPTATATPVPTATANPPLGTVRTIGYSYDAVGNRVSQDDNGAVTSYGYDDANRLTTVNTLSYTWDNNGNLLSDGTHTFQYDVANRLIAVSSASSASSFVYDGLSNRLSQTVDGVQTRYVNDPASGLTQVLADGTNTYLYGLGRIAQQQTTMQYFGVDGLGSVRQLYNSTGQIVANHRYDPFGNTISKSGVGTSNYGFAGEQQDASGLDYLRARYYDPVTGRFLSQDAWSGSLLDPASLNGWTYAENNPVLSTDPSGMCTSGIGFDQMLAGANTDFFNGGSDQILAGLNATWQECQQNWNKAQTAWGRGDYGRAVSYATGFTSDLQRATQWVYDNNRDWDILRDPGCNETVREAAGKRIFGRGFELAGWLVSAGIGAKSVFSKATLSEEILAEVEEDVLPKTRVFYSGGRQAELAAEEWASRNNGITLRLPATTPYADVQSASRAFAEGATGQVHVFQSASGVRLKSIWATIEYPTLMNNPNVIRMIQHVVMPGGSVVTLP